MNIESKASPTLVQLLRVALSPKSILASLSNEALRELVRKAAQTNENSGSPDLV